MSEPSVTEARTLTFLLQWLLGPPWMCRDCFPTLVREFRYKLQRNTQTFRHYKPTKSVFRSPEIQTLETHKFRL